MCCDLMAPVLLRIQVIQPQFWGFARRDSLLMDNDAVQNLVQVSGFNVVSVTLICVETTPRASVHSSGAIAFVFPDHS